jgi:hypothetical protein
MPGAPVSDQLDDGEAARYIASQNRIPLSPEQAPISTAATMVVLAGILHRARTCPGEPVPSLHTLISGWTGYPPEDTAALQRLHATRILTLADTSPPETFTSIDGILTLHTSHARFEPTGGPDAARAIYDRMTATLCETTPRAGNQRAELARLVTDMEVRAVLRYTDAMLIARHGIPAIPDELRAVFADLVREGLDSGYTCGQLAALAWQSVCAAADWMTHQEGDGQGASAAAVDFFGDRLVHARTERTAVPEHDIPDWAGPPVSLVPGRILMHHITARTTENRHR